jgi:hypothetical protein
MGGVIRSVQAKNSAWADREKEVLKFTNFTENGNFLKRIPSMKTKTCFGRAG